MPIREEILRRVGIARDHGLIAQLVPFKHDHEPPRIGRWITAGVLVLGLIGLLVILGATGAAPFLYVLF